MTALGQLHCGEAAHSEWQLRAVRVDQIETVQQDCGDAANGGLEPIVTNAAARLNGGFRKHSRRSRIF
jgi:hypothetical protein